MSNMWTLDNPAFSTFVFYSGVLALKMVIMSPLTGYFRVSRGAFPNPEDAKSFGQKSTKTDPDVERARRAHQNDLENIPIFIIVASLYLLTDPCPSTAKMLFRVFAFSRILHTVFYLRSSAIRPLFYLAPLFINAYMAGCIVYKFW